MRAKLQSGTSERPRISVFRSNSHLYVQFIDDAAHHTLLSISSLDSSMKKKRASVAISKEVGLLAAKKAKEKGITHGIFDRGSYRYHGRVASFVAGLREGGLTV